MNNTEVQDQPEHLDPEEEASVTYALSRKANLAVRIWHLVTDPAIHEGLQAGIRTVANLGITGADFVPFVGDAVSWGADAWKVFTRMAKAVGIDISVLDPSKDVGIAPALVSELMEFGMVGTAPSHLVETLLQARHDIPRIKTALRRIGEILRGDIAAELQDYDKHKDKIDNAMSTFGVTPPSRKGKG